MYILAIDCSTALGSVAVSKDSNVLSFLSWKNQKSHNRVLISSLKSALHLAGLESFEQIDLLSVGNGPGSFTGLRVALCVIKSLAYSYDLPIATFSSLRVLAENHQNKNEHQETVYTLQNAFAQKLFFAQYLKNSKECIEVQSPQVIQQDQVTHFLKEPGCILGCVHDLLPDEILLAQHLDFSKEEDRLNNYPQAQKLAILSAKQSSDKYLKWEEVFPLYLKGIEPLSP